jgi:hypothetical protein
MALGIGTVAGMALLLLVYLAFHSPARKPIWEALFGGCTLFCRDVAPRGVIFHSASAVWLLGAAMIGALPLAGRLAARGLERIVAWGLIAYALLVIPAAIVGSAGDHLGFRLLDPPLGPMLASVPAVVAIGWSLARGWRPSLPRGKQGIRLTPAIAILAGLVVASFVIQTGNSLRYPVLGFDELGYHGPLAVLFWREGSLGGFQAAFESSGVLSHPGGAELFQGLLLLIGGEPLALVSQVPFALLGAAGVALFGRRLGLWTGAGVMAGLFFLLVPMVSEQMGALRNDVIAASLLIATAAILAGRDTASLPARLLLVMMGLGLMMVTKLSQLPGVGALTLVVLWTVWQEHRSGRPMRRVWVFLGAGVVIALLAVAPWWIRNALDHGNPLYPLNLPIIGGGEPWRSPVDRTYVPSPLLWPLYPFLETYSQANGVGGVFAVGILPGLIAALLIARRRALAILGVLVLISLPPWILLDRREPRFLLGAIGLASALIPFALVALRPRWRPVAMAILVIAAGVTVAAQWLTMSPDPVTERLAVYDKQWSADPVANALPETEGILLDDRCGTLNRLYPWFGANRSRRLGRIDCEGATTARIERLMRRERLSHVEVVVPADQRAARLALYPADRFTIVHDSPYTGRDGRTFDRILLRHEVVSITPDDPGATPAPDATQAPGVSPDPGASAAPAG